MGYVKEHPRSAICYNDFLSMWPSTRQLGQGNPVPTADLTNDTSVALIEPSAVISERKFAAVTDWPIADLTLATSLELTVPFPLVSPVSNFIMTELSGRTCKNSSVTSLSVTVSVCELETPARSTLIVLPEKTGGPDTVPTPLVTVALPLMTWLVNVNTNV